MVVNWRLDSSGPGREALELEEGEERLTRVFAWSLDCQLEAILSEPSLPGGWQQRVDNGAVRET